MSKFEIGQRARVKEDAFPGSDEAVDVASRGSTGELIGILSQEDGGWLWIWLNDRDSSVTNPIDSELEPV
jgi:hypothetical protein